MSSNNSPGRTPLEWRKLITEQTQSGQTQAEFCLERGISLPAFSNARNRLGKKPGFVEIGAVEVSRVQSWEGEVLFPNGVTVRVRG